LVFLAFSWISVCFSVFVFVDVLGFFPGISPNIGRRIDYSATRVHLNNSKTVSQKFSGHASGIPRLVRRFQTNPGGL